VLLGGWGSRDIFDFRSSEVVVEDRLAILYVVNFYGTPPLNYFEKYIRDTNLANLTIIKLPAVRLVRGRIVIEAFLLESNDVKKEFNLSFWFPFFAPVVFALQYMINIVALVVLLSRSSLKSFDIAIGETSFGGAIVYLLGKLKIARFTVFMNGDVLPEYKNRTKSFYLHGNSRLIMLLDSLYIRIQYFLRRLGIKNDLLWYPSKKVHDWDKKRGYVCSDYIYAPAVTVDVKTVMENLRLIKKDNTLGYIGRLDESAGVDMALKSLKLLKERLPSIYLEVVGGGSLAVERYKKMSEDLGISENVHFHGFIESMEDALDILKHAKLGLALYKPDKGNVSLYTDASKPKEYIKAGIPVIITRGGPDVAVELSKYNAGVIVEYDPEKISDCVYNVLTDACLYERLTEGIVGFSESCDYKDSFERLVSIITDKYHAI